MLFGISLRFKSTFTLVFDASHGVEVGWLVGAVLGGSEGERVGAWLGAPLGVPVGLIVGVRVGARVRLGEERGGVVVGRERLVRQ